MAQKAKGTYIAFVYQPKAFFDLSQVAQIVKSLLNDIVMLNKKL